MFTLCRLIIILMLLAAGTAEAVQLGQMTVATRRGELLAARIELYGATAQAATTYRYELRPDIGTGNNATIADFVASTAYDAGGNPYVSLRSASPVTTSPISFRLRMIGPTGSVIQHYSFALISPPVAVAPIASRSAVNPMQPVSRQPSQAIIATPAQASSAPQLYGPIRPGQSLWRILQANGLTGGNIAATMARIVATNPQAFIAGDPDRLVAGVMLDLGASASTTTVTKSSDVDAVTARASAPKSLTASVIQPTAIRRATTPTNAATTARLATLEKKFAAIRARYTAQKTMQPIAAPVVHSNAASGSEVQATSNANLDTAKKILPASGSSATKVISVPAAPVPAVEIASKSATSAAMSGSAITASLPGFALPAGVALVGLLALGISMRVARRKRTLRHVTAHEDRELERMAQISAKAEKRLQLEDEVKRSFTNNRLQLAQKPVPAIERPTELLTTMNHGFEEIETRIAYGHYAQAADLLADVLEKSPRNHRAKLRLAEVYYLSGQREAFVALSVDIQSEHRAEIDDDEWGRIVRMGKIIAPESAPFRGPTVIESLQRVG